LAAIDGFCKDLVEDLVGDNVVDHCATGATKVFRNNFRSVVILKGA